MKRSIVYADLYLIFNSHKKGFSEILKISSVFSVLKREVIETVLRRKGWSEATGFLGLSLRFAGCISVSSSVK